MGRPKGSKNGAYTLIERTCEICSKSFSVPPSKNNSRFCSIACKNIGHSRYLFKQTSRSCLYCGKAFNARPASKQKFCSITCGSRYAKLNGGGRKKPAETEINTCPKCGKIFKSPITLHQKFCSKECGSQSYKRRIDLICKVCGNKFNIRAKFAKQKYCSRSCRTIGIGKTETYIERKMKEALDNEHLSYEKQYPISHFTVDFAFPNNHLIVECDGTYWHELPTVKHRDLARDKYMLRHGWNTLRFPESKINSDITGCISKIKLYLQN